MKEHIFIHGQHRKIAFNWKAVKAYEQETGDSFYNAISEIANGMPKATAVMGLAYAGLVGAKSNLYNDERTGQLSEITIEDVFQWATKEAKQDDITEIMRLYIAAVTVKQDDTKAIDPAESGSEGPGE